MTSIDNGIDIPTSPRLSEVGAAILAEQARHALVDDSTQTRLKLNLSPDTRPSGPEAQNKVPDGQGSSGAIPIESKVQITPGQFGADDQRFSDRMGDKIYPGLGRIESPDQSNRWRLDYVDPSRCKTKASVGMCFTLDWP